MNPVLRAESTFLVTADLTIRLTGLRVVKALAILSGGVNGLSHGAPSLRSEIFVPF